MHSRNDFLQENFGFIETLKHDQEVFFHFSNFIGNPTTLELGQEVEYMLSARNGLNAGNCIPAENVKVISNGEFHTRYLFITQVFKQTKKFQARSCNP